MIKYTSGHTATGVSPREHCVEALGAGTMVTSGTRAPLRLRSPNGGNIEYRVPHGIALRVPADGGNAAPVLLRGGRR
jgi:hypothetical protein